MGKGAHLPYMFGFLGVNRRQIYPFYSFTPPSKHGQGEIGQRQHGELALQASKAVTTAPHFCCVAHQRHVRLFSVAAAIVQLGLTRDAASFILD